YGDKITGRYDAKTNRVVINRLALDQKDLKTVQIYSGDFVAGGKETTYPYLRGTMKPVGGLKWGAPDVEHTWKALRNQDYLSSITISRIMITAHSQNKYDKKLADGTATPREKQHLLELYGELSRRKPPMGDLAAWQARTKELLAAARGVVAGQDQA